MKERLVTRKPGIVREGHMCCLAAILATIALCSPRVHSQVTPPRFAPRPDVPDLVSFFAPLVLPKVVQDTYRLKEFVRSPEFAEFRSTYGDVYAVDAIFDAAMRFSWNNTYEALFITLTATMDHRRFGVRVPLLGSLLWVPLTSEFEEEFQQRVKALPRLLYHDSPKGGDRDKLQHFFGSALLAFLFESREAADRVGEFIEWGEDRIIVDGVLDERDFRANRQGQEFGMALLEDREVMPSMFLRVALARLDSGASRQPSADSLEHNMEMR